MNKNSSQIGKSLAGRDKGRYYAVIEKQEKYVLVADGKLHKLESPKRKNEKHIKLLNKTLLPEQLASDKQLRKALSPYNEGENVT